MLLATPASGTLLDWSLTRSGEKNANWRRALAAAGAVALTAAAAQVTVPLPFTSVPFVLTPLAVLLTGAALGPRLGPASQAIYLMLGIAGAPVFAPSATLPPGVLRLAGPTGGFLMAYPLAAWAAGYLAVRGWDRRYFTSVIAMMTGLALLFAVGIAWFALSTHTSVSTAFSLAGAPFIPLDVAKVFVAAAVLPQTWRVISPRD